MKNKEKKNNENKVKFGEKLSLGIRKKWLVNGSKTLLIVAILFAAYIALNLWVDTLDLPQIDVTQNKIYTISETTKKAIADIDQDVKIYAYGFEENGQLIKLLKQYNKVNSKINYEILTEESNYAMVQENGLSDGYTVLIFESGDSRKVVDASSEFSSYDYTTGQSIDTTEQTITNSILSLLTENKPKIYFTTGHQEYDLNTELVVLSAYLQNEAFEISTVDLATQGKVPDDCDVLAMMSPATDIMDVERDAIINYINKGGNIYYSTDVLQEDVAMPNIQAVLDQYGVSVENGYILELKDGKALSNYPNIFNPEVSSTSDITADIYTDSKIWLAFSARLKFKTDEELENLNVTKEDLMKSSDEAIFVTNLSEDAKEAANSAEKGESIISSMLTKTLDNTAVADESEKSAEEKKDSTLIIVASGSFITNYKVSQLNANAPLSNLASNKDFVINAMAKLGEKDNRITIRKDMASSTYTPTEFQNNVVLGIIFGVPIFIILVGIFIWRGRNKRK